MQQDKRQVPDWLLERLALGELDADAAADVRRRLAAEGRSADDARIAIRGWTKEDIQRFDAAVLQRLSLPESELDIVITGRIYAGTATLPPAIVHLAQPCRPVRPGVSISHFAGDTGTLGALVEVDTPSGTELHMLSNNHILGNCISDSNPDAATLGDKIVHPGGDEGGQSTVVGWLSKVEPLRRQINHADAARALCDTSIDWDPEVPWIGRISGMATHVLGSEVRKVGRSTGPTKGRVSATAFSVPIEYPDGVYYFDDVVEVVDTTMPFSRDGDSGAVILDTDRKAVGLLFAGGQGVTYANAMFRVKAALGFSGFKGA